MISKINPPAKLVQFLDEEQDDQHSDRSIPCEH